MELGLAGKVALVTGSTRGIGLSIAEHLLDEGAHFAICARSEERVTATVARLSDQRAPRPVFFEGGPWEVIKAAQPEYVASVEAELPMGRWATPADVARAVTFLSSPAAEYISGTALVVDGGFLRRIQH